MLNFDAAVKSKDLTYQQDVILDELAHLIKQNPRIVEKALKSSGVQVSSNASLAELIDGVSANIHTNIQLQSILSGLIAQKNHTKAEYSNFSMDDLKGVFSKATSTDTTTQASQAGAPKVSVGADPISAIAGAIGTAFSFAAANQQKKANQELAKAKLYEKIFGDSQQKKNWVPIVIISAVLIIGGVVAYVSLKKK